MEKECSSTIWPILYFKADWPSKTYSFDLDDLDVQLIRAEKLILDEMTKFDTNCWNANPTGRLNFLSNTNWFVAMRRPQVLDSVSEKGISFVDNFQSSIVDSFRMCLQLVRSTEAISPFKFLAEIRDDTIDAVDTISDDFEGINSDKPDVYLPEIFEIGDLQLSSDLWSAIIKLRKLDFWSELVTKEEFFAALDKATSESATKKMVELLMSHSSYSDLSEKERKQHKEEWTSSIEKAEDKGEWWQEYYKEIFEKIFLEKQEEVFLDRTRIGRALNLFFKGIQLPLLHSFLSMCLVMETLFTIDEGETTHKLTTRLAKIIGSRENNGKEERKELYKRAKKVYEERSNIVHGAKLIDTENNEVLKDAFFFARRSLQCFLLDPGLLALYSHPGTMDKKVKGKIKDAAKNAIRDYFLDLDLQCD